jgi:hypothetical protein
VSLYNKYQGRVHFVVVDMDLRLSSAQLELVKKYYRGYIPHVVVLDASGKAVYNQTGEVEEGVIAGTFDKLLK